MKFLLQLAVLMMVIGCASNAKKAKEHMEKGNWEKAHQFWVSALKEDPNNEEAIEGKREAENQITNKKLVQLRNSITAGKSQQAVDTAWEIEKMHKEWGYTNVHAMSSFHNKQIKSLYPLFVKLLKTSTYKNHPLKGYILVSRFEPVFSKRKLKMVKKIKADIEQDGKAYCQKVRGGLNQNLAFHHDVVVRMCRIFGVKVTEKAPANKFLMGLHHQIKYSMKVKKLKSRYHDTFKSKLTESLESTPYYHGKGKRTLQVKLSGSIREFKSSRMETRYKDYETTEKVKKYKTVYLDGQVKKKPEVKEKKVTKTYSYLVRVSKRTIRSRVTAKLNLAGKIRVVTYNDEVSEEITNHNNEAAFANVHPVRQSFSAVGPKMDQIFKTVAEKSKKSLEDLWFNKFCKGDLPGNFAQASEKMMKCRLLKERSEPKVARYLQTFFEISHKDDIADYKKLMGFEY